MSFFSKLFKAKKSTPIKEDSIPTDAPSSPGLDYSKLLTSQLLALYLSTDCPDYRNEYLRRLKLCGASAQAISNMETFETEILRRIQRPEMLDETFVSMPLFSLVKPFLPENISYYESHFDFPLSYIVKLSDEAEWHFWNSHEKDLSDDVWSEIFMLADRNRALFLPTAIHMTTKLGWTVENVNKFSYHEQGMLDRYRWGTAFSKAAVKPWS